MSRQLHYHHHDTPKKSRVKGAYIFAEMQRIHYGHQYSKRDIFKAAGVSEGSGYAILQDFDRRFHNNPFVNETRGRKKLLTDEDLDKVEHML
jgi:hypothetical protein